MISMDELIHEAGEVVVRHLRVGLAYAHRRRDTGTDFCSVP